MKVVVFCDFNGVINLPTQLFNRYNIPAGKNGYKPNNLQQVDVKDPSGETAVTTVEYSTALIKQLNSFADKPNIVWYWLSNWRSSMLTVGEKIGCNFNADIASGEADAGFGFKTNVVTSFMAKYPNLPVIWVEDVETAILPKNWWVDKSNIEPLVIKPDTNVGLTVKDMTKMSKYVAAHVGQ